MRCINELETAAGGLQVGRMWAKGWVGRLQNGGEKGLECTKEGQGRIAIAGRGGRKG